MSQKLAYYVYILKCGDSSFYTGITTNLERRIKQHNGLLKGGARYTQNKRPTILMYQESYLSRGEALKREYKIKQLSKVQKENLIQLGIN